MDIFQLYREGIEGSKGSKEKGSKEHGFSFDSFPFLRLLP